ncbi:MAG: dihydropteroate synthase [Alphaproteobacteria bacterium]|nr:dihydropteroate synthase [Alphaproteobacteria bacterium]
MAHAHGSDARRLIAEGRARPLPGFPAIAYCQVEEIARQDGAITRRFVALSEVPALPDWTSPLLAPKAVPTIMGIVNVTPDSFSDGGLSQATPEAIAHGLRLAREGAHIVDVGGESTRPGSDGVSEAEELDRVIPVIEGLVREGVRVSCDTRKAKVMAEALKAGAAIINDVSALAHDPRSIETLAGAACPVILMHAQGDPRTMQLNPTYEDAALDVYDYLAGRIAACEKAGIARARLAADPGIGFGKTYLHNLDILQRITLFHGLGVPILVGLSRKSMIGALTGEKVAAKRIHGSVGGALWCALNGVHMLRVHDVKGTMEALAVAQAAADPEASVLFS